MLANIPKRCGIVFTDRNTPLAGLTRLNSADIAAMFTLTRLAARLAR